MSAVETREGFELLLRRPPNYFKLSAEQQWEIDKNLGALDVWCDERHITPEMRERWNKHFGVKV